MISQFVHLLSFYRVMFPDHLHCDCVVRVIGFSLLTRTDRMWSSNNSLVAILRKLSVKPSVVSLPRGVARPYPLQLCCSCHHITLVLHQIFSFDTRGLKLIPTLFSPWPIVFQHFFWSLLYKNYQHVYLPSSYRAVYADHHHFDCVILLTTSPQFLVWAYLSTWPFPYLAVCLECQIFSMVLEVSNWLQE